MEFSKGFKNVCFEDFMYMNIVLQMQMVWIWVKRLVFLKILCWKNYFILVIVVLDYLRCDREDLISIYLKIFSMSREYK